MPAIREGATKIGVLERLRQRYAFRITLSTRARILGGFVLLMAVALVLGLFVQRLVLRAQLDRDVNAELSQEVEEVEQLSSGRDPATGQPFGTNVAAIFDTFLRRNIPFEGEALFTLVDGQPYASTATPLQLLEDPVVAAKWAAVVNTTRAEIDTSAGPVRYLATPVQSSEGTAGVFVVAIFIQKRQDQIDRVIRDGAIVFGSIFVGASALSWFVAGRVLRPVSLLTKMARAITEANWAERIPVEGDDEIAKLARTFNDMLDRLEAAFATQRRFIDDAGHELRTPITIIRGHLELLGSDPHERDETMRLVIDELDRMTRIVEDLLVLAKSEHADFLQIHPLDVAEFTHEVATKAAALGNRRWSVGETAQVVVTADRQRLTQALMNLARNAVEHTAEGTLITLGSRVVEGEVQFWVRDQGEGIAPADLERIFERFSRATSGRRNAEGAGLGLAIVQVIVSAHGGRVIVDSAPGRGSTFTLALPANGVTHP
jgi:two-component system OmpR family sensor kinase